MEPLNNEVIAEVEIDNKVKKSMKFDVLEPVHVWAYGIGHFLNDLLGACWFNYLLIYLTSINPIFPDNPELTSQYAGYAMLMGQVADAISNTIVGIYCDKVNTSIGKRKPWYLGGTIFLNVSYIFIFRSCLFCEWFGGGNSMALFYYLLFPALFNIGFSGVQIAHMALVPSLSSSRKMRDKLATLRNTFTYVANFTVLVIALIVFAIIRDDNSTNNDSAILAYEIIVYALLGIGDLTSIFFIVKINEPFLTKECSRLVSEIKSSLTLNKPEKENTFKKKMSRENSENNLTDPLISEETTSDTSDLSGKNYSIEIQPKLTRKISLTLNRTNSVEDPPNLMEWFKKAMFYQYGLAYMGMRVLINVGTSMLQFYIVYVLHISSLEELKKAIPLELAIIPLILYLFSVVGSYFVDKIFFRIGRKMTLVIALALVIIADILLLLIDENTRSLMYLASAILGVGQAFCLNTSYSMISEVIGQRGNEGAFVFGCYSFAEKLMNGILLFLIMNSALMAANDPIFIRSMIVYVPTGACILGSILIFMGKAKDYKVVGEKKDEDDFVE